MPTDTKKLSDLYKSLSDMWEAFNFYEMKTDAQFTAMEKAAKMLYKYKSEFREG